MTKTTELTKEEWFFEEVFPIVGYYELGGVSGIRFALSKRPNWLHRLGVRIVLGWIWKDELNA